MSPQKTTTDWFYWWRDARYEADQYYLATAHNELHAQYGAGGHDGVIVEIEQELSRALRSLGIEHRFDDSLAKAAGTIIKNPIEPTFNEVSAYSPKELVLDSRAIEVLQDADGGQLYIRFNGGSSLRGMEKKILKAIQSRFPPGVEVKMLSGRAGGTFASSLSLYRLALVRSYWSEPIITTWDRALESLRKSASTASDVFKDGISLPFHVIKDTEQEEERLVTGMHLEPGVIDTTKQNADGTPTGAVGDSYTDETIKKAMYWWMENANHRFSYYHTVKGGLFLTDSDVRLLENWQARQTEKIGEQEFKPGTWLSTVRIINDSLWDDIKAGRIQSWSIGAMAMAAFEEIEVKDSKAA
jgi:hypothetical protein